MIKNSEPIFAVRDVQETIAYYRNVLGGRNEWLWGEPVSFGGIRLGHAQVMFCLQPDLAANVEGHQHQFFCDDIDELHDRHAAAGATIVSPIGNKPWGLREYTVRDPSGYHLRFGGTPRHEKPATARDTVPDYIAIDERLATPEEYAALARSVGWQPVPDAAAHLDRCCYGVVAVDRRDGGVVGMLRVMQDAGGWYSIWDVIVRPEHQDQRIGTAMLEKTLAHLRARAPGANVHLFTHSPSFYARLGFRNETCTFLRL